jgi:2-keto-3-deoxygluconate permease
MEVATAQVASAVLVSAVLAPLLAAWVLKRQGGIVENPDAPDADTELAESKTV